MIKRNGSVRVSRDESSRLTRALLALLSPAGLAFALGVQTPTLAQCQIYAGQSESSGTLVLSSFASAEANTLVIAGPQAVDTGAGATPTMPKPAPSRAPRVVSEDLRRIVEAAAARTAVPAQLIHAVIEAESRYEPAAVSPRGAIGLMQLLPATAKRFGAQDPFDPGQNVAAGTAYLKWLMTYFDEDLELVLAGYNAGEQAVVRAGRKIPPYNETKAYVRRVMATLDRSRPASL